MSHSHSGNNATLDALVNAAEWMVRPYREGDIPAIVALLNTIDSTYKLGEGMTEEEMRMRFSGPRIDPMRQAVVVEGPLPEGVPPGRIIGLGRVSAETDAVRNRRVYVLRINVHPAAVGKGLERLLASRLASIMHGLKADRSMPYMGTVLVRSYVREELANIASAWEEMGMVQVRQHWTMARSLHEGLDDPAPVERVLIRPFRSMEDSLPTLVAYNNAFSGRHGHREVPPEEWQHWLSFPHKRLDLSWVAEAETERSAIAGFCICSVMDHWNKRYNKREGWIDLLGTTSGWRRQGLGRALLLNDMLALRAAGLDTAMIEVDSQNLTGANRLYESVGFRLHHREMEYEAALESLGV